ncbi:hypothetical protein C1645_745825 [Glomus cerebriforme]|uniref:G-protein coupled receptors family 1 profile domain-containing protein n=1 Tax=Glomus cerebriforme TaxID=658196 RepID=A0A397S4C3_9GLOM|nr:hypothetical protein C1645_745825 [Glomus cerebriforme]
MITSAVFLFIFLVSCCNATNRTHIDQDFKEDVYNNHTDYDQLPKLDDTSVFGPDASRDFYVVLIFGLATLQINLFGSLYVIYKLIIPPPSLLGTYLQWKREGRSSVPLSLRFPFYIALTDAFLSLAYTINLSYTLIFKLPWGNPACQIIGAAVTALFILNMFLVGIIAFTTWCYVCKEHYIEFGSYDYKLWTVILVITVATVALSMNKSGQQKYWCAGRHHSMFVPITMIVFIFVILITILVSYIKVLLKIRSNDDNLLIARYQRARIEKRALRKLISYIFTFILQFIENVLLHVLAITTINFGGIGNFIQFAINEGLFYSAKPNSPSSSIITDQIPQQTISVVSRTITTYEIRNNADMNQPNTNDKETTPSVISEVSKDVVYNNNISSSSSTSSSSSEDITNNIEIKIDDISDVNDTLDDDDKVLYDCLMTFDATTLVSANSSDGLLNHDDDFWQELNHYTEGTMK